MLRWQRMSDEWTVQPPAENDSEDHARSLMAKEGAFVPLLGPAAEALVEAIW